MWRCDKPLHTYKFELDERTSRAQRFLAAHFALVTYLHTPSTSVDGYFGPRDLENEKQLAAIAVMASSTAVQVSAVAVLALLRSRSTIGSPHGSLSPYVYATDDAVSRSSSSLPNATGADHDIRMDHARHSYDFSMDY